MIVAIFELLSVFISLYTLYIAPHASLINISSGCIAAIVCFAVAYKLHNANTF